MPIIFSMSSQKYFRGEDSLKDDQAQSSCFPKETNKQKSGFQKN